MSTFLLLARIPHVVGLPESGLHIIGEDVAVGHFRVRVSVFPPAGLFSWCSGAGEKRAALAGLFVVCFHSVTSKINFSLVNKKKYKHFIW